MNYSKKCFHNITDMLYGNVISLHYAKEYNAFLGSIIIMLAIIFPNACSKYCGKVIEMLSCLLGINLKKTNRKSLRKNCSMQMPMV